jgi:predicted aspartyl protease
MLDAMGILRTTIAIEHPARRGIMVELSDVIVDTGSEYTWVPQPVLESIGLVPERVVDFVTADGRQIERGIGFANIYAAGTSTPDIVVFAARGDLVLLGARSLDGLNLRIDLGSRRLVPGGPVPAAVIRLTGHARESLHPHPARLPYLREHLGVRSP